MIYLQLFWAYLKIGFFGFGGGYAMLSLIHNEVVDNYGWISSNEFTDIVAISQVTPGPIAINSATYIGYSVTGNIWGSLIATIAVCLPALTIMLFVTRFYLKLEHNKYVVGIMSGIQPVMIGLIAAAALLLMTPESFIDYKSWLLFGVCFIAAVKKVNPIWLIIASAAAGVILYY